MKSVLWLAVMTKKKMTIILSKLQVPIDSIVHKLIKRSIADVFFFLYDSSSGGGGGK
jgi:hypothetical protein